MSNMSAVAQECDEVCRVCQAHDNCRKCLMEITLDGKVIEVDGATRNILRVRTREEVFYGNL